MPQSSRTYKVSWTDGFPKYVPKTKDGQEVKDANGQPEWELKWDLNESLNKLRFGEYTAKLVMLYDDGRRDVPQQASASFWVIPWRLIGGVLGTLILPSLFVYWLTRRRYQKKLRQQKRSKS